MFALGTPSKLLITRTALARTSILAVALFAAGSLAACGGSSPGTGAGATPTPGATSGAILGGPPAGSTTAPPPTTAPAVFTPLNCSQLAQAAVTTATVKLPDYPFDSINLTSGRWSAEDGTEILLQTQCGIGDFIGDASLDAVGVVTISAGGTGRFYQLVGWRNTSGAPVLAATAALGDRNPVLSISIVDKKITVVYLTRTDAASMAELNLKRTAIFKVSGTSFVEVSHTDVPYTP